MKHLLIELLGIDYPIIQAPMAGGLTTPDFVANVSNFGMLGSIASTHAFNKLRDTTPIWRLRRNVSAWGSIDNWIRPGSGSPKVPSRRRPSPKVDPKPEILPTFDKSWLTGWDNCARRVGSHKVMGASVKPRSSKVIRLRARRASTAT
ncbi:MAG: hypothetical protein HOH48_07075 [Candidatus Puniceispirillum sp.]|uniref:nitronate monooxygenase n=1 Tax=Candidatus Puniceispirillum sp. TaxID=2026719 RepID=UPI001ED1A56A|nr:hypothetical protein [Candidatus Puniceispirillum sp.]MBT6414559.1 hypothetical protein [Candidatus Puniceispirillum sp.]MBT6565798.1 hypothetical protein [Candidatus Puniceispirillum sp.]